MIDKAECTFCPDKLGDQYIRIEIVNLPYNPNWNVEISGAGRFCSRYCAIKWLENNV